MYYVRANRCARPTKSQDNKESTSTYNKCLADILKTEEKSKSVFNSKSLKSYIILLRQQTVKKSALQWET